MLDSRGYNRSRISSRGIEAYLIQVKFLLIYTNWYDLIVPDFEYNDYFVLEALHKFFNMPLLIFRLQVDVCISCFLILVY